MADALAKMRVVFETQGATQVVIDAERITSATSRLGSTTTSATGQAALSWQQLTTAIVGGNLIVRAIEEIIGKVSDLATLGVDYQARMETATLGIASSFMVSGQYVDQTTGKVLEGQQALQAAQQDSVGVMDQLRAANMQTIATLDQLVRAYQETLPVAMAKGFDRDQVLQFTTAMVQAAGAIGMSLDQMGQETRSILTGSIDPRDSRIATVLGLRNEDIAEYEGNAQGLFDFLMQKLDAYKIAGVESQKTWAGLWSNMKDIASQATGMAMEPVFETIKYELGVITGDIVKVDNATGKIEWNPEFISGIDSIKDGLVNAIGYTYALAKATDMAAGAWSNFWSVVYGGKFTSWGQAMGDQADYFYKRALRAEEAMDALAKRAAGLDSNGNRLEKTDSSRWGANPVQDDEKAIEDYNKVLEKAHDEYLRYSKSFDDRVLSELKNSTQLQLNALESRHTQGLVSERQYLEQRYQLQKAALQTELEQVNARFDEIAATQQQRYQELMATEQATTNADGTTSIGYDPDALSASMKAETQYQNVLKERQAIETKLAELSQQYDADNVQALERQRTEILAINDATQQSYEQYLSTLGVRKEAVDLVTYQYDAERKLADLELQISKNQTDPAKLTALQDQLAMETQLATEKERQLRAALQISLQNEQFSLQQQQIDQLKKQGLDEEAFGQQKVLDQLKTEFDYRQKMIDYQNELNQLTQQGLATEADMLRQNMSLYTDIYNQSMAEIQNRTYTPSTSGGSGGGSTTNWSGLDGVTYTIQQPVNDFFTKWADAIRQQQADAEAAAQAAAEAWQRTQEAAATLADDLSVRYLAATGQDDAAKVQKLLIDQQSELNQALSAGVDVTQLLAVQQLEYNKTVADIQQAANDKAVAAQDAYLAAKAAAEGTYYGTGLDLLQHIADAAEKTLSDARSQLDAALQDYSSSISSTLASVNDNIKALAQAATDLRATSSRLLGGADSTLSPEQQYLRARLDYTTTANAALGGDLDALQRLSGLAEAFISASRGYYASGAAYASDFQAVQDVLATAADTADQLGASLDPQVDLLNQQLDVLQAIRDAIKIDNQGALEQQLLQLQALGAGTDDVATLISQYQTAYDTRQGAAQTVLETTADNAWNTWQSAKTTAERAAAISTNTDVLGGIDTATGNTASTTAAINKKTATLSGSTSTSTIYEYVFGSKVPKEESSTATTYKYNAFAAGGLYPGGLAVMGEEGPELVDSSPGYVYTAQETREILNRVKTGGDNAEAVAELRQMNAELREQNRQLANTVQLLQAGFTELLRSNQKMESRLNDIANKARLSSALAA